MDLPSDGGGTNGAVFPAIAVPIYTMYTTYIEARALGTAPDFGKLSTSS